MSTEGKIYLDRYRIRVDQIGIPLVVRRTANEATLQADDLKKHDRVAIQIVPVTALSDSKRERLEAEAGTAKAIKHINIPLLRDFGFDGDQACYVTKLFEGTTAEDWIKTKGPMPASVALRIASQFASALGAAAFHGVIHPAISPANILLVAGQTPEGEWPLIKVLNFFSGTRVPAGASDFASPEAKAGAAVDFRSQIYSLGKTLWFLLKGTPLHGGVAEVEDAAGVPSPIKHLLAIMLADDPEERPFDPLAFEQQIQSCIAQTDRRDTIADTFGLSDAASTIPATASEFSPAPRRGSVWKPFALAAVLLVLAAAAAVFIAGRTRQNLAIGVPVGVPQTSVAPVATEPPTTATIAPQESSEPEVLTSTANAADENMPSAEVVTSDAAAADPAPEAAAPIPEPTQPMTDASAPAEPASESAKSIAEVSPPPTDVTAAEDVQKDVSIASVQATPEPTTTPEEKTRVVSISESPTPIPRARTFTTAEGRVLFPVPPTESAIKASPSPRETRRRSRRTVRDPLKDLPVLPALPPD